jgi:hypothetical protein
VIAGSMNADLEGDIFAVSVPHDELHFQACFPNNHLPQVSGEPYC